jgi:site-specific recombinase XerD
MYFAMENTDLPATQNPTPNALERAKPLIAGYAANSKAANTWRAYRADLQDFADWCRTSDLQALPALPETVAAYLAYLAPHCKVATVKRRLSAISQQHQAAGHESPTRAALVRLTMQGIRRTHAPVQTVRRVQPAITSVIYKLVDQLGDSLIDSRDRALILIGFAGAFRRSELTQLRLDDITETEDGLRIRLRQSKTDQEGDGLTKGIPFGAEPKTCPVLAWRAWRSAADLHDGRAFRSVTRHGKVGTSLSDQAVADVIKRRARAAGLDYAEYSGHSLRAGLITAAAMANVPERVIAKQSGHKSLPVLRTYIREGSLFTENAAAKVGL